jgi:hypothetical protein
MSAPADNHSIIFAFWRSVAPCALPILMVIHRVSRDGKKGITGLASRQAAKAAIWLF